MSKEESKKKQDKPKETPKSSQNAALKYSAMGIQTVGTLLVFAWLGQKLDSYFGIKQNFITLAMLLLGIAGTMAVIWKNFIHKPKK